MKKQERRNKTTLFMLVTEKNKTLTKHNMSFTVSCSLFSPFGLSECIQPVKYPGYYEDLP